MALVLADRVQETTTTTGTGTLTLAGAVSGFQSFTAIGNANTTYYTIVSGTDWEVGIGTYTTSGTTLSRDTVLDSSASGAKISVASGATVFATYPADKAVIASLTGAALVADADNNIAVGNQNTQISLTTGTNNIAIGSGALQLNDIGYRNIAVGSFALNDNTADDNVAVGYNALNGNTTGINNVAVGTDALKSSTTGINNVATGYQALYLNSTGNGNVALGYNAGRYETASNAFYVDNQDRTNTAGDKAGALMYGTFNATPASQTLKINAAVQSVYGITSNALIESTTGGFKFPDGTTQTTAATGGGSMVYPSAGIPNSTGTAWGTSYGVTGTGSVVLSASPTITGTLSAATVTATGNLTFTGTGNRITGDFSNATVANRVIIQTSTPNENTNVEIIPGVNGGVAVLNLSSNPADPSNCSLGSIAVGNISTRISSTKRGTGTYLPMVFTTNDLERMRIHTSGGVSIGNTTDDGAGNLSVTGFTNSSSFRPTSATVPTNGLYLPAVNNVGFATNSTEKMRIGASGEIGLSGANYGTSGQVLTSGGTGAAPTWTTVSGTGTVTSVGLALPSDFTVSGSPVTSSGTLTGSWASQTANTVLAAPNGSAGTPTFRSLVSADIPDLMLNKLPEAWVKMSCQAATTANITLSGTQTVDGVALIAGNRCLVKNQTAGQDNGIYDVSAGTWSRSADANAISEIAGAAVNVDGGTVNGGKVYDTDFKITDTLGTTAMNWYSLVDTNGATFVGSVTARAGTATAGTAPIYLQSGANLTTAQAGAIEYDGTAFYSSMADSTRGVMPSEQIIALTGTNTLTSQTGVQAIFDGGGGTTNGAVTLPVGTYSYETSFCITGMSATSGSFGFSLGGTATKTFSYNAHASKAGTSLTTPMALVSTCGSAAITTLVANSTGTVGNALIKGIIRVTVAGTIIPQMSMTVASAAVIQANGYFKVAPIGNATVATVGNWT